MKRYLFLWIMVLVTALSGCQKEPKNEQEEPIVEKAATILDQREKLDDTGILSYISNPYVEDGIQQQISNFQGNLLISSQYFDDAEEVTRLDLELVSTQTGELLYKTSLPRLQMPEIQILERNIVVKDSVGGHLYLLNASLEQEKEYELTGSALFLNKMMTKAFYINEEDGLGVMDLETGTKEVLLDQAESVYVSKVCQDYVTLTYLDRKTDLSSYAVLNLATEEIQVLELNESFYSAEYNAQMWLAGLVGENGSYFLGTEENPQIFDVEDGAIPEMTEGSNHLLINQSGEEDTLELTAYGLDGTYQSGFSFPNKASGYWANIAWFESLHGYLFTCIDETGTDRLYYWDLSVPITGTNLNFSPMKQQEEIGNSVSEELYQKATALGEKYGITVKIADQCDTDYGDYTVERNFNEKKISRGLDVLDQSLSSYPDGFMKQLYFGYYRKLEINLMGNIYATDQVEENKNGFDSFIAFVQHKEGKYVMTFDLSRGQLIEQDLYHEISHLIDQKLQNLAEQGKTKLYSEEKWDSLNPKGFDYTYNYADVPASYYYDGYDDYFVDVYSRTFPTEDRARIMEYAMIGADFCFDTYKGLEKKLDYYCQCIREGFDTTGWPETTKWEEILRKE